ncbi:hypothetical protein COOONC_20367 [Cooperia oncophora]
MKATNWWHSLKQRSPMCARLPARFSLIFLYFVAIIMNLNSLFCQVTWSQAQSSCQQPAEGLKIQSRESLRLSHLRRQRAIRRCLFMATVQMILNTPYYTLQLIDEVYSLQSTPSGLLTYLYMDAVLYLLYLCQFPLVALNTFGYHI